MRAGILIIALMAVFSLPGCGSEENKLNRGVVVDREEAVPGTAHEFDMTDAERQQQLMDEDAKREAEDMDQAEDGD